MKRVNLDIPGMVERFKSVDITIIMFVYVCVCGGGGGGENRTSEYMQCCLILTKCTV